MKEDAVVIPTINKMFTFKIFCLEVLSDEKGCIQRLISPEVVVELSGASVLMTILYMCDSASEGL